MKYYLANEVKFLSGIKESATAPSSATHMKLSKATAFIESHPKYTYYKERSTSKGNDYVICTPIKLVGNDFNSVSTMRRAKGFGSIDEAFNYLQDHRSLIDMDITYVVDENMHRKKLADLPKPEPVSSVFVGSDTSDRVKIPDNVKDAVFAKSNGICPICGKSLSKYNYTIDHIVPLSRGGTNNPDNMRAVHLDCNRMKNNFTDKEFIKMSSHMVADNIYSNPSSDIAMAMIRSIVRGSIKGM